MRRRRRLAARNLGIVGKLKTKMLKDATRELAKMQADGFDLEDEETLDELFIRVYPAEAQSLIRELMPSKFFEALAYQLGDNLDYFDSRDFDIQHLGFE